MVLLKNEVNPVMSAPLNNGLEVTALHNHFFWEEPRVYYMDVMGHAAPCDLAHRVKPAVDLIGRSREASSAKVTAEPGEIDMAKIVQIVGCEIELSGAVYKNRCTSQRF